MGRAAHSKRDRKRLKATAPERLFIINQQDAFAKKFGRPPGPADPMIFDPESPPHRPLHMREDRARPHIVSLMRKAGISPAKIYAFEKTGMTLGIMIKDDHRAGFTAEKVAEWRRHVEAFEAGRVPCERCGAPSLTSCTCG